MNKISFLMMSVFLFFSSSLYAASHSEDYKVFNNLFLEWTKAFNSKDLTKSCALFSKQIVADYQGYPTKNYNSICGGFERIFKMNDHHFQYKYTLHDVYRSGDLVALRVTWYLYEYDNHKLISMTQDEGIDIFKKSSSSEWQIINYIAYGKVTAYK